MKQRSSNIIYCLLCVLASLVFSQSASAQLFHNRISKAMEKAQEDALTKPVPYHPVSGYMQYEVDNGDTVYLDYVPPVWVFPKHSNRSDERAWRKFYKYVYNFARVYPYALIARKLVGQADSTIAVNQYTKFQKQKYVNAMQKELFGAFEKPLRHMTISQGQILMRLVYREVGKSPYSIIKDYKNGIAATFWQGIAKLFSQDLKAEYDPQGRDKVLEDLVQKWDSGKFDQFYYGIFFEYPSHEEVPEKYR
jgi:hypothetical protein